MTLARLILVLQYLQEKHGNLEIAFSRDPEGNGFLTLPDDAGPPPELAFGYVTGEGVRKRMILPPGGEAAIITHAVIFPHDELDPEV